MLCSLCFNIQALDPHLRHGPRKLGRASGAGHSLPGARPLDPLVHMFNASSVTHPSSHGTALAWWWLQAFHTLFYIQVFTAINVHLQQL